MCQINIQWLNKHLMTLASLFKAFILLNMCLSIQSIKVHITFYGLKFDHYKKKVISEKDWKTSLCVVFRDALQSDEK